MRHEIHRLQTITDHKGRRAGCLQYTARGYVAFDPRGMRVGHFATAEGAARKLCSLARRFST